MLIIPLFVVCFLINNITIDKWIKDLFSNSSDIINNNNCNKCTQLQATNKHM